MPSTAFLRRVRLKNYRSIGACDVKLGPLTVLVGPNGAGKSNFVDALRFVADALNQTLDHAIRDRGGINEVRRRTSGHPTNFSIRLDLASADFSGHYAFEIGAAANGSWSVRREECDLLPMGSPLAPASFEVAGGAVRSHSAGLGQAPPAAADRLYLVNASGSAPFRSAFDALSHMGFYNLNPEAMRELQPPDAGHLLDRDGSNIASTLARLESDSERKQRLLAYLAQVVPGVVDIARRSFGPRETIEFRQQGRGARDSWTFTAQNMSDGTLRALGVLLALQQGSNGHPMPLVAIEEPEAALHPHSAGVLLDALREASSRLQVVATSHSAELLDTKDLPDDAILAVTAEENETRIGPVDRAARDALRERLYTAGELLRMNQLQPDPEASVPRQMQLFGRESP